MDLEGKAIARLQMAAEMSESLYKKPLVITYSGGKDSDVLLLLAERSGIEFEVLHSLTTADAPQTIYHVREVFHRLGNKGIKCEIDNHKKADGSYTTMWNLIPKKMMPPTRLVRYCCSELKETGGTGRFIATGVRWDESAARKKNRGALEVIAYKKEKSLILSNDNTADRRMIENCTMKGKRVVNPIIDWKTHDVVQYAESEKIKMNPLYACGYKRVGCIGCPMAGKRQMMKEFAMFPKYKKMYIRAFEKMISVRKSKGLGTAWETADDVFHWWLDDGVLQGQIEFELI